ncbi:iron-containing alcohol dehydrogenase [uncultured Fusobacterium sp.]|uniref:iron-containing alcohol dehydrogenase n=1 Tax=uncultured Fusobacterium sp. TaxID=159267 RepID=UPI000BBAC576|nr:iron-containing alcohol dehydrogenase [uncultured Fusobacterium sp.]BBA49992.1 lactaldehyde:propanediol oxidoreductase [Fusobacterium varium]
MIYYIPPINLLGRGCLAELKQPLSTMGCKKALVVSDKFLMGNGTIKKVTDILKEAGVDFVVYDEPKPNPTVKNVEDGYKILKDEKCDLVVSIGGGSPQDCGKAIAVLATNGGNIKDYEGVNKTKNKSLPIIAITTTAGTSAEVTINYVITDEERHVKMIMVDTNSLAAITVNDPELMMSKPAPLTAATGMDALTHAIEAVVAKGAMDVTDCTALYAIKEIFDYLPRAVKDGSDIEAREQMCYSCFLNGIAFSNAGLGNVHAMAHQLGGLYDLPHGVCNAMLLPIVEEENAKNAPEKFRVIAQTIGYDAAGKTDKECVDYVIGRIKALSEEVGIPKSLKEVGVDNPDFELLAENAMKDACAGANPVFFDKEKLVELFKKIS